MKRPDFISAVEAYVHKLHNLCAARHPTTPAPQIVIKKFIASALITAHPAYAMNPTNENQHSLALQNTSKNQIENFEQITVALSLPGATFASHVTSEMSHAFLVNLSEYMTAYTLWEEIDITYLIARVEAGQDALARAYLEVRDDDPTRNAIDALGRVHDNRLHQFSRALRWDILIAGGASIIATGLPPTQADAGEDSE